MLIQRWQSNTVFLTKILIHQNLVLRALEVKQWIVMHTPIIERDI